MWSPLGEGGIVANPRWVPEPETRGSFNILSTCIITLSLCTWSALHLNVPEHGASGKQKWYKAGMLIMGLLAPEMVVVIAYRQRRQQKSLVAKVNQLIPDIEKPSEWMGIWTYLGRVIPWRTQIRKDISQSEDLELQKPARTDEAEAVWSSVAVAPDIPGSTSGQHSANDGNSAQQPRAKPSEAKPTRYRWTSTHGYFAVMGGYAFDTRSHPDLLTLPEGRTRLTLTNAAIHFLAEHEPSLLPNLSQEHILDKSKANHLAKFLVCVQATWFCLQIITRMGSGLAVTLLELTTLAHALCALLVYLIWWNKPMDVDEPALIVVDDSHKASVCAALCLASRVGRRLPIYIRRDDADAVPYYSNEMITTLGRLKGDLKDRTHAEGARRSIGDGDGMQESDEERNPATGPFELYFGQRFDGLLFDKHSYLLIGGRVFDRKFSSDIKNVNSSNAAQLQRSFVKIDTGMRKRATLAREYVHLRSLNSKTDYLRPRVPIWPFLDSRSGPHDKNPRKAGMFLLFSQSFHALTALGIVYGFWHLLAWDAPFGTRAESIMWKLSAAGVTGCAAAIWVLMLCVPVMRSEHFSGRISKQIVWLLNFLMLCGSSLGLIFLLPLLYLFSRVFILVESFLSLPYAPDSTFLLPQWSTYFPHIS